MTCAPPRARRERFDAPELGRVVVAVHAVERMAERGIGMDELAAALESNPRKLDAALALSSYDRPIRVALGRLFVVLHGTRRRVCVVTLYRRGASG